MRKKLDTRFPAARIKKIMQTDEDVGKIAMAVPLLVSKALELFLQDLCDRTYEITLKKGAKTVNSLHLKHCVQSFNVFDFLRDVVSRVPDLGGSDAAGVDRSAPKRRKVAEHEENEADDESKRSQNQETGHNYGNGRGRGGGRGRGRGRGSRTVERDLIAQSEKFENGVITSHQNDDKPKQNFKMPDRVTEPADSNILVDNNDEVSVRNFDLNVDLNENGESQAATDGSLSCLSTKPAVEVMHEEYPGWSLSEMEKMDIDPIQLANLSRRIDEEEEDYDEEG